MPFKSEAQRRYLWANEPEIARDWADTYGSRIQKENGGIMRLGFQNGNNVDDEEKTFWEWLMKQGRGAGDWTKQLPGMAFSALSGIPGIGFLLSSLKSDPRDKYLGDPYSMQNYMGTDYGYGNELRHGRNITGQDQFGINTRSMFGDYQGHYGNFMNDYLSGKIRKTKFNRNKFEFAKDVTGTKDTSPNITGTPLITQTSDYRESRDPPTRGTFTGAHPDRPTKTPEQGGWHPGVADGGLIDFYKNGGFSG
jgi:hypothetical protein